MLASLSFVSLGRSQSFSRQCRKSQEILDVKGGSALARKLHSFY
jgi:hypothetical protein